MYKDMQFSAMVKDKVPNHINLIQWKQDFFDSKISLENQCFFSLVDLQSMIINALENYISSSYLNYLSTQSIAAQMYSKEFENKKY